MIEQIRHQLEKPASRIGVYFIGGTLVWALYLMSVYPLTSLTCHWGWFAAPTSSFGLKMIQCIITVIAGGLVAGCAILAFGEWCHTQTQGNRSAGESLAERNPLLAFVTAALNSLYFVIIVVSLVPIFVLPACA